MLPELIETPRLRLRASGAGDGTMVNAAILETFDQLHLWMPWAQEMPSVEQSEAYAVEAARKWAAGTQFDFNILLPDGAFVGRIGAWPLVAEGDFELGYWCRASQQGRGYMSEAVRAVCHAARKYLGAARLVIRCDGRNVASQKVALRCGFELFETRLADTKENDGSWSDTLIFTLGAPAST